MNSDTPLRTPMATEHPRVARHRFLACVGIALAVTALAHVGSGSASAVVDRLDEPGSALETASRLNLATTTTTTTTTPTIHDSPGANDGAPILAFGYAGDFWDPGRPGGDHLAADNGDDIGFFDWAIGFSPAFEANGYDSGSLAGNKWSAYVNLHGPERDSPALLAAIADGTVRIAQSVAGNDLYVPFPGDLQNDGRRENVRFLLDLSDPSTRQWLIDDHLSLLGTSAGPLLDDFNLGEFWATESSTDSTNTRTAVRNSATGAAYSLAEWTSFHVAFLDEFAARRPGAVVGANIPWFTLNSYQIPVGPNADVVRSLDLQLIERGFSDPGLDGWFPAPPVVPTFRRPFVRQIEYLHWLNDQDTAFVLLPQADNPVDDLAGFLLSTEGGRGNMLATADHPGRPSSTFWTFWQLGEIADLTIQTPTVITANDVASRRFTDAIVVYNGSDAVHRIENIPPGASLWLPPSGAGPAVGASHDVAPGESVIIRL
jgi:hypothetical protein